MLHSLYVKNYRNLKSLKISALSRVNLFTGKNNTGKSSILEAIAIYASKGDTTVINQILTERGESFRYNETNQKSIESNIRTFSTLFTNREIGFDQDKAISIGPVDNSLFGDQEDNTKSVSLRFVKYVEEVQKSKEGEVLRNKTIINNGNTSTLYRIALQFRFGESSMLLPLDEVRPFRFGFNSLGEIDNFQFIRTRNIDRDTNGKLWDNITLTEKEGYVIDALKIIEPNTERIAFIEENPRERIAVIKIAPNSGIVPLSSMGDGINRVLSIILALVNADNGFLLLDEFENGLHYTVQEQLWKIIIGLAEKLNIQVFATTHSNDCIAAFEKVLNNSSNSSVGKLIRLENHNGKIEQIEFSALELKIAQDQDIETR